MVAVPLLILAIPLGFVTLTFVAASLALFWTVREILNP